MYYFQDKILLHPEPLSSDYVFDTVAKYDEFYLPLRAGTSIHVLRLLTAEEPKGAVLYFHGNYKNSAHYLSSANIFLEKGWEVWMADYPGFGKSTGDLTEGTLLELAIQLRKRAGSNFAAEDIILYGRSFGTALASYTAAHYANRMLILESPYTSIPDLFKRYAFIYPVNQIIRIKLPQEKFLKEVKEPVLIIHGVEDNTIPIKHTRNLESTLKKGDRILEIDSGTHNGIAQTQEYADAMKGVLE